MEVIAVFIGGLALGSFVNALVWRVRKQSRLKKPSRKFSIMRGRSMCTHCHHRLAASDLVPVLSWLYLHGKCRYCSHKIDDSPWVECITAATFSVSYAYWPFLLGQVTDWLFFACWLAALTLLIALAVYDMRWMELPNRLITPLVFISLGLLTFESLTQGVGWSDRWLSATWGVVTLFGLFYALFQWSKGRWIGGGDVKLAVVIGILVGGPVRVLLVLFLASALGSLIGLPKLLKKRQHTDFIRLPFGPLLIGATYVVYLFGEQLIDWYVGATFSV